MEEILRFENVTIGYNEKDIIKDFSCTVNRGEFVSLIGPNGSGKSTLIHAITGIVGIRKGKIYINGKDNEKLSAKERAQITAVVPQTFQASFAFKAKEIVAMGRHPFLKRMQSETEEDYKLIDQALEQKPADFDALLKLLEGMGCEVSRRGQSYSLKAPGWDNAARMSKKLGKGYSEAELRAVLAGEKEHTPTRATPQPEPKQAVSLMVDIQEKLRAGKGAGYQRWATGFNLKQMAQTMNYLSEHKLFDYKVLSEKTAAATARYNELSAQIKAAEKRMTEIAVLRTHIINYAKTREVYVAYRKAGYSKKFRAEHEADILLHQTAKKAFDELGMKKLPTVKSLQTEYAELMAQKKAAYSGYRQARDEMKELLTVKANVDRIMGYEEEKQTEKDHSQEQRQGR